MASAENLDYTDSTFECILSFCAHWELTRSCLFFFLQTFALMLCFVFARVGMQRSCAFMGQHFKPPPKLQMGPICSSAPSFLRPTPISHFYLWPFFCVWNVCVCVSARCHLKSFKDVLGFHCVKILSVMVFFFIKKYARSFAKARLYFSHLLT